MIDVLFGWSICKIIEQLIGPIPIEEIRWLIFFAVLFRVAKWLFNICETIRKHQALWRATRGLRDK